MTTDRYPPTGHPADTTARRASQRRTHQQRMTTDAAYRQGYDTARQLLADQVQGYAEHLNADEHTLHPSVFISHVAECIRFDHPLIHT